LTTSGAIKGRGIWGAARHGGLGRELWALLAIAQRDLVKLLRDRARLAVNLAFPILLVAGLGSVLQPTVGKVTGISAVTLAFTGVLPATLFQSTAAGMISIAEDRETDFSRVLFVAPVSRLTLMAGKICGETTVALFQGACVVAFAAAIGVRITGGQLAALLLPGLACCLLGGAFGLVTVVSLPNQRSAMDVFQFLIIPQYLLGGVLVPLHGVPGYIDVIAGVMPLRYAVDLVRGVFFRGTPGYQQVVSTSPVVDAVVIAGVFAVTMTAGALIFDYRERAG
jgi:ABC-2 type transport system permease protein